ncbi:hypothetical protein DFR86_01535 [Acidianus sulfidivorans JP7]|uniref:Thermopsin n=1 Tax=Acidianus sulfidivorans JP7 TaxID=619593 RepID=A0A2U9IK02_9CREN|nr:thermopsin family protease [Acidianus sulfidivorans]AWR96358.1 hypothetical protein DFR86_01535 [Acidianus sulfidivorans JP7]
MLRSLLALVFLLLVIFPSLALDNASYHVLQRQSALAPEPNTKAPYIIFPFLYRYVSIGSDQQLIVITNFSSTYILSVFTPIQFEYWVLGDSCDSEYSIPVSNGTYYIPLPKGEYVVTVNDAINASPNDIKLIIGSLDFYSIFYSTRDSVSTGIASYGFYNYSGHLYPYTIKTSAIMGYFNISSISTKNDLASLQLNSVLEVKGNVDEEFWLQNAILFNIYDSYYSVTDEVWNFSSYLANISSVKGNGNIGTFNYRTYYSYTPPYYSYVYYSLPLAGYLIENVSVVQGKGVYISFGYVIIQSGKLIPPVVNYYDKVFIDCPNVKSANIVVKPNFTGSLNPYDVELVFGGYYPSSDAIFTSLQAKLSLMYNDSGKWSAFPSLMSYGLNTLETSQNIHTVIKNGIINVVSGSSSNGFLTNKGTLHIPGFTFVNESGKVFYITSPFSVNIHKYIIHGEINYTLAKIMLYENGTEKVIQDGYIVQPNNNWFEEIYIIPYYIPYDLVTIVYPNGTVSEWVRNDSSIVLPRIINVSSVERYVLNSSMVVQIVSPSVIRPKYVLQYLVTIVYPTGRVVGWYDNGSTITFPRVINVSSVERYVLNSSMIMHIVSSGIIRPSYMLQYFVTIVYPNGTVSEWVRNDSSISLPRVINVSSVERYVLNSSMIMHIISPGVIVPSYILQYFVTIVYPTGRVVGWYDNGSTITFPRVINVSSVERYVLNSSMVVQIVSPSVIRPKYVLQYLVTIVYPTGRVVGWYDNGSTITFPRVINLTKELFTLVSPASIIVVKSMNLYPTYLVSYLEKIILPNGTILEYIQKGKYIVLPSIIQVNKYERYVLNSTQRLFVNASETIKPFYILQYLVKINGHSEWINKGEKITIEAFTTPFFLVKWIGNIHVFNGETITVNQPIDIKEEKVLNPLDYLLVAIAILIIAIVLYIKKFKHK